MFIGHSFNLASVISTEKIINVKNLTLNAIPLDDVEHKTRISENWYWQYYNFVHGKKRIPFFPGDDPDPDELVFIDGFTMPPYIKTCLFNNKLILTDLTTIKSSYIQNGFIKSIISSARVGDKELILFQKFQNATQLPGIQSTLSLDTELMVFQEVSQPLITLGDEIICVYDIKDEKLIFKRFSDIYKILDLDEHFKLLSAPEIEDFVTSELFESNIKDLTEIIHQPSPLLVKRFSLVKSSGIIESVSAQDVKNVSKKYENISEYKINVELSQNGDKIIFPTKKSEVHNLLRLLNQDFYTGDLDGNQFLSRGKKNLR